MSDLLRPSEGRTYHDVGVLPQVRGIVFLNFLSRSAGREIAKNVSPGTWFDLVSRDDAPCYSKGSTFD